MTTKTRNNNKALAAFLYSKKSVYFYNADIRCNAEIWWF